MEAGKAGQIVESDDIYREPRDVQAKVGSEPAGHVNICRHFDKDFGKEKT